jgi:hypothetical protein
MLYAYEGEVTGREMGQGTSLAKPEHYVVGVEFNEGFAETGPGGRIVATIVASASAISAWKGRMNDA